MDHRELVNHYFAAVNAERWDDVVEHFDADATLDVPGQPTKRGSTAIRRFYEAVPRLFPEHHDEPVVLLVDGDDAIASIEFTGRTASGRKAHFWAADTFRLEAGKIRSLRIVFDPAGIMGSDS